MITTRRLILGSLALAIAVGRMLWRRRRATEVLQAGVCREGGAGEQNPQCADLFTVVPSGGHSGQGIRAGSKIPYISKQGATTEYQQETWV